MKDNENKLTEKLSAIKKVMYQQTEELKIKSDLVSR